MNEAEVRKRVGENITRLRKAKGLPVEGFANYIGMDKANFIPIEKGRINVTISTLFRIADGLQVDVKELFKVRKKKDVASKKAS